MPLASSITAPVLTYRLVPAAWLMLAFWLCSACGTTLRDVPTIKSQELGFRGFPRLVPPSLSLEVIDERPVELRENAETLRAALTWVLSEALTAQAIAVASPAPQRLTVRVRAPADQERGEFERDRCVSLHGRIARGDGMFVEGSATACHRGGLGGGNISIAYRRGMGDLLSSLASQLEHLPADAFDAPSVTAPVPTEGAPTLLTVRVEPAAALVSIDGVAQPIGSVESCPVAPGQHSLRVSASGLVPDERAVSLVEGQHLWLSVRLAAGNVQITRQKPRGNYSYLWIALAIGVAAGTSAGLATALAN